jgi:hypothetical protein
MQPDFVEYVKQGGDINEWFAKEGEAAARAGDTEAAREILRDFVWAIDQRSERPPRAAKRGHFAILP